MTSYVANRVYYRVTYSDVQGAYPQVESFVFIGKNLSDEDETDAWYFQPAQDFIKRGRAGTVDGQPVTILEESALSEMLDVDGLGEVLLEAQSRH